MELRHTLDEIKKFSKLRELANKLEDLQEDFSPYLENKTLRRIAGNYRQQIREELSKYDDLIGTQVSAPSVFGSSKRIDGTIISVTKFGEFPFYVECKVKYDIGGWGYHKLSDLHVI